RCRRATGAAGRRPRSRGRSRPCPTGRASGPGRTGRTGRRAGGSRRNYAVPARPGRPRSDGPSHRGSPVTGSPWGGRSSHLASAPRARAERSAATRSTSPGGERGMHPDLPHEQAYFDRALALRDRQQARLAHAPALAANPKAALELRKRVSRFGLTDPDEAVAFGRIDTEDDRWYIGKSAIWDDDNELVVVNWQAPIAAPFYTATPERPEGLVSRRLFRCTGNQIREIEDTVFRSVQRAVEERRAP